MTGFHLHQHSFCLAVGVVYEGDHAVYAFVAALFAGFAAFLAAKWFGLDKRQGPPLELIAVILGKLLCCAYVLWLADYLELDVWEHLLQAVFLEGNAQMGDIDADPLAA